MKKTVAIFLLVLLFAPAAAIAMTDMAEEELADVQGSQGLTFNFSNGGLPSVGASFTSLSWTDGDGVWGHPAGRIQLSNITMSNRWEWSPVTLDVTSTGSDGWLVINPPNILNKNFAADIQFIDPSGTYVTRTAGRFGVTNLNWLDTGIYTNDFEIFTLPASPTALGLWIGGEWRADNIYWQDDGFTGYTADAFLKTSTFAFYNSLTTLFGYFNVGSDGTNSYFRFTWPNSVENNNRNIEFGRIGVVPTLATALTNSNTFFGMNIWGLNLSQDNLYTLRAGGATAPGDIGTTADWDIGFNGGSLVFEDHDGFAGNVNDRYLAFNGFHMRMDDHNLYGDICTLNNGDHATSLIFYDMEFTMADLGFTDVRMGSNPTTGGGPSLFSLDFDNMDADIMMLLSGYTAGADPNGIEIKLELGLNDLDVHFGDSDGSTVLGPSGTALTQEGHFYLSNIKVYDPNSYSGRAIASPMILQTGTNAGVSRLQLSMPDVPMTVEFTSRVANASNVGNDIFMHQISGSINFNGVPVQIYPH